MVINPLAIVGGGTPLKQSDTATKSREITDREGRFIATVLRDTEVVWSEIFKELGDRYQEPKLVLFKGGTHSACGSASAEIGPFYCPADQKVYIDLGFFHELVQNMEHLGGLLAEGGMVFKPMEGFGTPNGFKT